jgi:5-formyltetrahydrofolate cyclo-ligase
MTAETKSRIRREVNRRLEAIPSDRRVDLDSRILHTAETLPQVKAAGRIMAYFPLADEVDLRPLVGRLHHRGKELCFPRVERQAHRMTAHLIADENDLVHDRNHRLGLSEPAASLPIAPPESIDVILVPGRAFNMDGHRLGRGGGYYDAFLAASGALRLALAYDEQIVESVPLEPHDLPVHLIVTPTRILHPGEDG